MQIISNDNKKEINKLGCKVNVQHFQLRPSKIGVRTKMLKQKTLSTKKFIIILKRKVNRLGVL